MKPVSRRDFLKITALMGGGLLVGGTLLKDQFQPGPVTIRETRTLMGTVINLTVVTPDEIHGRTAVQRTFQELERLTAIFNHRQADSPLARLNREGFLDRAPGELTATLQAAIDFGTLTQGAFDVTVKPLEDLYQAGKTPLQSDIAKVDYRKIRISGEQISLAAPGMAITLDGIAKGRVVDGGVAALLRLGFQDILVEAGGDLMARGLRSGNQPWHVAVQNPRKQTAAKYTATFAVSGQGVATSGDYVNYFSADFSRNHIIDPHTGSSPTEIASSTVIAPDAMTADALSTSLMVLGADQGLKLVSRLPGVEALLVRKDLSVARSPGFPTA